MLAVIKRGFENDGDGKMHSPPKQNKQHKCRAKPRVPAQPLPMPQPAVGEVQTPVATAAGVPVPFLVHMLNLMLPHGSRVPLVYPLRTTCLMLYLFRVHTKCPDTCNLHASE